MFARLGPAESLVDNFFWPRWRFKVGVFDLFSVGRGQGIDETVERGKIASIGALDGLVHSMIARGEHRVGRAHVGEVPGGVGFPLPRGEPFFKRLAAGKHCSKRSRIPSAGDACEVTKEEGEIDLLKGEQIGTIRLLTVRLSNDPPARFLEQSGDLSLRLVPPLSGIRAFEKLWIRHTVSWPG